MSTSPTPPPAAQPALHTYQVTLEAAGSAIVTVQAADYDAAETVALEQQPGFIVAGGTVDWQVVAVEEVGADAV